MSVAQEPFPLAFPPVIPEIPQSAPPEPSLAGGSPCWQTTELSQADRVVVAEKELLEQIIRGDSTQQILHAIVTVMEDQSDVRSVSTIMLVDKENNCLKNAASHKLPPSYLDSVDGVPIDSRIGTCPVAAAENRPVFTPDIETDPCWEGYQHLVTVLGLWAAWSVPIRGISGEVLGTISCYFHEKRLPDEREIRIAHLMAATASLAICRSQPAPGIQGVHP